jgi:putative membrane protein
VSPLLWRWRGWVRVTVTIAGLEGDPSRSGPEVLIPVAPRHKALALIAEVLPGVDVDLLPFVSAPAAARWRSPITWRTLAVAVTPEVIATRAGRITSRIAIAPHAHVQSVRLTQGAWERRLGLASVHADTAPGPVRVIGRHLAEGMVRPLADQEVNLVHDASGTR